MSNDLPNEPSSVPPPPPPPPPQAAVPPTAPQPQFTPPPPPAAGAMPGRGAVPTDLGGVFHSKGLTILLMIVTLGIWGFFWTYHTNEELKKYNGDGLGGVLGIVLYFFISIVLMFTIPNEIKNAYERDGRPSPVSAVWGLWFLLPIIGHFIWYLKVQGALNDFWASKGAVARAA